MPKAASFRKPTGSTKGIVGAKMGGSAGSGKPKLQPNNHSKSMGNVHKRCMSAAGKKGNRGPKRT